MPDKNNSAPEIPPSDVEKRVDDLMTSDKDGAASSAPKASPEPAIDIFKDLKTAPVVSSAVLKKAGVAKVVSEPVNSTQLEPSVASINDAPVDESTATVAPEKNLDDATSDAAVDAIVAGEGDQMLADQDAATAQPITISSGSFKAKLQRIFKNKWTWIGLVALVILVFAVPFSRYKILGLAIHKSYTVSVIDSKTKTPVSSVQVWLAGKQAKTDAEGKATLRVPVGSTSLKISKQYYKNYNQKVFVKLSGSSTSSAPIVATGRQVPVTIINKISGKPLAGADIKVLSTNAKTDKNGRAIIVLPASASSDKAIVSLAGYNTATASVAVTDSVIPANTVALTPTGKVYFLSNASGSIDVVKTNLDGSDRQTVLSGTGKEDSTNTILLASRDWQYLVLESQRDSTQPALYLISTSNDKLTKIDSGDVSFSLIGWYNHNFIYDINKNSVAASQSGRELLKSYNADQAQLNQLDQNQVAGTASDYAYQSFSNFYILNNLIVYNVQWYQSGNADLSAQNDSIRGVQPTGQDKKDYQTFAVSDTSYVQAALYEPNAVYYAVHSNDQSKTLYYQFEDNAVTTSADVTAANFNKTYPTYLVSPSGRQTFWSDLRDGQNSLSTGNDDAGNKHAVVSTGDYKPYGWYSDDYLLVSKNNSQLYIMPVSGSSSPLKLTDYYKPAQSFIGYGYGYGGL